MNKKGFTLVELIIVIAVMAILAAIVIPRMSGITQSFRVNADIRSCETLAREIELKIQLGEIGLSAAGAQEAASGLVETTLAGGAIDAPRNNNAAGTVDFWFTYTLDGDGVGTVTVFIGTAADTKFQVDSNDVETVVTPVNVVN